MIRIERLNKYYRRHKKNENHVLRDLNLDLPSRGLVAIFGRSGCGKTTLLSVIGGMDTPSEGSVSYLGRDTRKEYDRFRNESVGYIFQSYLLQNNETVFENVSAALRLVGIADPEVIKRRTEAALSAVGMARYRDRLPKTLSGGQQQRVAIARAIVKNPPILLADEPTGNLDEANTVAIMELLRAISREHLVLLVTHEENLVARYADRIITLSDGIVVSDEKNLSASLDTPEDARKIYLGDLPMETQSVGGVTLQRYGEGGGEISLTLVTKGNETYLRVDSGRVHLLDESSEISLVNGKYEPKNCEKREAAAMNMADLPHVTGKRFGRLFGWRNAFVRALCSILGRKRRRDRALRLALVAFSVAAVFLTSILGSSIDAYLDRENSYAKDMIYVYTPSGAISEKLLSEAARQTGTIRSVRLLSTSYVSGQEYYYFRPHAFETYRDSFYYGGISTNASLLPIPLAEDLKLISGKRTGLAEQDILITTAVADQLLSESTAGYLSTYGDLLGISMTNLPSDQKMPRIAGIVKSSERVIYFSEMAIARLNWNASRQRVAPASDYGYSVASGEVVFATVSETPPQIGSILTLRGESLSLTGRVSPALGMEQDRYLISDEDYVRLSNCTLGSSACFYIPSDRHGASSSATHVLPLPGDWYSVLCVSDISAARSYLEGVLGKNPIAPSDYSPAVLYPSDVRALLDAELGASLWLGVISLAVALGLLSLAVAMLMRSTLFTRVKEIGILRAIGVSRRNLLLRFTVESMALALVTVFPGFLLASVFVCICHTVAPPTATIFFYPLWLASVLLILLLSVSVVFGILPILRLLTPTPSKILSKYDV